MAPEKNGTFEKIRGIAKFRQNMKSRKSGTLEKSGGTQKCGKTGHSQNSGLPRSSGKRIWNPGKNEALATKMGVPEKLGQTDIGKNSDAHSESRPQIRSHVNTTFVIILMRHSQAHKCPYS